MAFLCNVFQYLRCHTANLIKNCSKKLTNNRIKSLNTPLPISATTEFREGNNSYESFEAADKAHQTSSMISTSPFKQRCYWWDFFLSNIRWWIITIILNEKKNIINSNINCNKSFFILSTKSAKSKYYNNFLVFILRLDSRAILWLVVYLFSTPPPPSFLSQDIF